MIFSLIMTPSLLVCGSQAIEWSDEYLSWLREALHSSLSTKQLVLAIREIPRLWETLLEADSTLQIITGKEILERFEKWLDGEELVDAASIKRFNILSSPLTVISQLVEYLKYLENDSSSQAHLKFLNGTKVGGIQGFCTGFLSAISLCCSRDGSDILELGAVAIRLAVCIGAYVDLDQHATSGFECVAMRWDTTLDKQRLEAVLANYDTVYDADIPVLIHLLLTQYTGL